MRKYVQNQSVTDFVDVFCPEFGSEGLENQNEKVQRYFEVIIWILKKYAQNQSVTDFVDIFCPEIESVGAKYENEKVWGYEDRNKNLIKRIQIEFELVQEYF